MKFYELYKNNKVTLDDIDDYIDSWHDGDSKLTLHEYLGLTWEQYKKYVEVNELEK